MAAHRSNRVAQAFTLVELLVVVAILVVLLALLAPAVDRAVYQAELAVCAGNLHGVATGATSYALSSKRRYPERQTTQPGRGHLTPVLAGNIESDGRPRDDDRPVIRDHIRLAALVDPLVKGVDLTTTRSNYVVASFYTLWFNVRYPSPNRGMYKLGDRFTWDDSGQKLALDLIASDTDAILATVDNGSFRSSHPDDEHRLSNFTYQDVQENSGAVPGIVSAGGVNAVHTQSWWGGGGGTRGGLDLNYARADESVLRLDGVTGDDQDERLAAVPYRWNGTGWRSWRVQVPFR